MESMGLEPQMYGYPLMASQNSAFSAFIGSQNAAQKDPSKSQGVINEFSYNSHRL